MAEHTRGDLEAAFGYRFHRPEWLEHALTHSSRLPEIAGQGATQGNERLEFLGDAVLGLLVSEHLSESFPDWDEGLLSKARARLVNGKSLCAAARRLDLGRHLRLGRGEEKTGGREKPALLADAYEAVVAAIYLDGGLDAARDFVQRSLLAGTIEELGERLGQPDHKSGFQEFLQSRGLPPAKYSVVDESGPDHRKLFVVEVRLEGQTVATGQGRSKKEAEQSAARLAMKHLAGKAEAAKGK